MILDRNKFARAIAEHLDGDVLWAEMVLSQFLESENIDFGDPGYCWTLRGARDIAEEELSYGN